MESNRETRPAMVVGDYELHHEIAAGGMAAVHLGRRVGAEGFARTVAIKRLHPHLAREPDVVTMFVDEARLASRIRHPNVVSTLDVVKVDGEVFVVMDYVHGESLARLFRILAARNDRVPLRIAAALIAGCLRGLHAAHEARDAGGAPLEIVHRDVSPQNILVGVDGVARLLDFGIAKAEGRLSSTREGEIKGKLAYMAPEQLDGEPATRRSDVFGAAVVFWEILTTERLFHGETEARIMERVLYQEVASVRDLVPELPESIDRIVKRGLAKKATDRFDTAIEMALAIEEAVAVASLTEVSAWLEDVARDALAERAAAVARVERAEVTDPSNAVAVERPELRAATTDVELERTRALRPRPTRRWPIVVAAASSVFLVTLLAGMRSREKPSAPSASAPATIAAPAILPQDASALLPVASAPATTSTSVAVISSHPPLPSTRPRARAGRPAPASSGSARSLLEGLPSDR